MKTKKRNIVLACALLAVVLVVGTFAYWNQTSSIDNPFDTGKYGSTVVEDFKPEDGEKWQPGVEINKDVVAVNTGDQDLIVRVKLDETWTRKGETDAYKTNTFDGDVYTVSQDNATDGLTAKDKSIVTKNFSTSTKWIDGEDGWFYYQTNLAGGATTDKWLDSVELLNDADMGKMQTTYYVTADETISATTKWYPYTGTMPAYIDADGAACAEDATGAQAVCHNKTETTYAAADALGYSDSNYVLTVTVQTVQATQEAIDAVFGAGAAFTAPDTTTWVLSDVPSKA